ncbi:MAG TPA: FAD-dependent oxidoreductase [Acidimicrobiia bacterium]|jgi:thioredoxin reductase (NADPH)|nr:FAD-dependent oxidoreductase [Acidimicrobiia bacterium]
MANPVLLAVDGDQDALRSVEVELRDRYGRQYRVECLGTANEARALLRDVAESDHDVALVLAGVQLEGVTGDELLDEARRLHPHARRALMIAWGEQGDPTIGQALFDAIASGRIDHYVIRPASTPDEFFHHEISALLLEWADAERSSPHTVFVVGESWSGRAYELREALGRCALPHSFCLTDSVRGRELVAEAGEVTALPLVIFPDGTILQNPTNADLALASGSPVNPDRAQFDLVIVGAGPAGLSAAVYGASEGFSTLVVDEGGLGGQATSSSLIRNYLGFPQGVSGSRLAQNAYEQAWIFGAKFAFMQQVTELEHDGGELSVVLSESGPVAARAVLLATGVSYRRLGIPALEDLNGAGVYYGGAASEAQGVVGREVYIVGGANSAGQAALHLARYAAHVTLVVRAESLRAGMSHYLVQQVEADPNVEVRVQTEVVDGGGNLRLEHLTLRNDAAGSEETVRADALFLMIGARPHTEWLPDTIRRDEQGFVLCGPDLADHDWSHERGPFLFETSMRGVFAAGDVRHGSVKRVASAVGEGSVAIQLLHQFFAADQLAPLGRPRDLPETVAAE